MITINEKIAAELNVKITQVNAAIQLLDEGATVPFISRYRKEATGGLTDTELRVLHERLDYLRELEERRQTILQSIAEQQKLTPELTAAISQAEQKAQLEDLYLPYKPKRRTKAQIAREAGLLPLAEQLLRDPNLQPEKTADNFIDAEKNIHTTTDALDGARHILMEQFAEHAHLLGTLRHYLWAEGVLKSEVIKAQETVGQKFADYFHFAEAVKKIPSHRLLAMLRGQREGVLQINLFIDDEKKEYCLQKIRETFHIQSKNRAADDFLNEVVTSAFRIKIMTKLELDIIMQLREQAQDEAIKVFANNLKHLLMLAPAGSRVTMGLDPGIRTGVKVVVIDGTGKLLTHETLFPHAPRHAWDESLHALAKLCATFHVELISIGNGTASRETDKLVSELKKQHAELTLTSVVVSEAGASVYSASELAAQEFPTLDVSYRGAVSIARRLQDPLAELVKIEPKSIGVGQYQHDVNQVKLARSLHAVMEDCVNAVGVDVNTASPPLLACISGLNATIAQHIVTYRDQHGAFRNREVLKNVPRLGEKAFEQAAGFLRILNGDNPLDTSAVHPEAYVLVERILADQHKSLRDVMGNTRFLQSLTAKKYTDAHFGLPTVTDILHELEKPGRDPRPEFKTATFKEGIETLQDLKPGMILEGVVTNVSNFGAFVDIGVHQDGLVHISMLADHFVKDVHQVVKVGDIITVKVVDVDIPRKRIQLSRRLNETPSAVQKREPVVKASRQKQMPNATTLGSALTLALQKRKGD